jgi:hypothetical protein
MKITNNILDRRGRFLICEHIRLSGLVALAERILFQQVLGGSMPHMTDERVYAGLIFEADLFSCHEMSTDTARVSRKALFFQ